MHRIFIPSLLAFIAAADGASAIVAAQTSYIVRFWRADGSTSKDGQLDGLYNSREAAMGRVRWLLNWSVEGKNLVNEVEIEELLSGASSKKSTYVRSAIPGKTEFIIEERKPPSAANPPSKAVDPGLMKKAGAPTGSKKAVSSKSSLKVETSKTSKKIESPKDAPKVETPKPKIEPLAGRSGRGKIGDFDVTFTFNADGTFIIRLADDKTFLQGHYREEGRFLRLMSNQESRLHAFLEDGSYSGDADMNYQGGRQKTTWRLALSPTPTPTSKPESKKSANLGGEWEAAADGAFERALPYKCTFNDDGVVVSFRMVGDANSAGTKSTNRWEESGKGRWNLKGAQIEITEGNYRFSGALNGDRIEGAANDSKTSWKVVYRRKASNPKDN